MARATSLELLAFNLKLLGPKSRKNVLISAGQLENKRRMLPAIRRILSLDVDLFATPGTHRFLSEHDVKSTEIHKITDSRAPNILTFLKANRFDLVINILTGDEDYDESSDAKLIRKLSIENGIPLITDCDVGIATLEQIVIDSERGTYRYKLADDSEPWNLKLHFLEAVEKHGGIANHHAHFDKAYLITMENLRLSQVDMQKKWELYKYLKENYTHSDLVERISRGVETMIEQGVTYCRTMVDADSTVRTSPDQGGDGSEEALCRPHPVRGRRPAASRRSRSRLCEQYEEACEIADYCGGLPSRDRRCEEKHLDVILDLAKRLGKTRRRSCRSGEQSAPARDRTAGDEDDRARHARPRFRRACDLRRRQGEREQDSIIEKIVEADLGDHHCPSAALSMKQLPMTAPLHNSIAPSPNSAMPACAAISASTTCTTCSCRWSTAISGRNAGC